MTTDEDERIDSLERKVHELRQEITELRRTRTPEPMRDYSFLDAAGNEVSLAQLFGSHDQLVLVHNMGRGCSYCAMWADGFVGLVPHLQDRAAFVLTSPDEPEILKKIAETRGWNFPTFSLAGDDFVSDMGFQSEDGGYQPGVSSFAKAPNGTITRVAKDNFGPGDLYCPVWHFLDLLPGGAGSFKPRVVTVD